MKRLIHGVFWIVVYLTLTMAPLFVLLLGPGRPGRGFWRELSVALGFAGLAMMGLQFLLTARYRMLTAPYGIDIIYHFHRQISLVAFGFILAHPLILFITSPDTLALLNPFTAPLRATLGVGAVIALTLLIVTSLKRLALRLNYEVWRTSHGLLATLAVMLAMGHVILVGYYVSSLATRVLWIALGVFWIGALAHVRIVKPLMMLRRPYKVEAVIPERGQTYNLVLSADGHSGMRFRPGQFAWLTIRRTPFDIREHPFSLSSSALRPQRLELTIKDLGDFTGTIKTIQPGTRAYLDGPYGAFSIDFQRAPGYVFIGGGIGITPLMSMLRTMADRQDRRPVILLYGSEIWDDVTFREELEALEQRMNLKVVHVLNQPPDDWQGETGFVTVELLARHLPDDRMQREYFICGPEPMIHVVEQALNQLGIPPENVHSERFNLV